MNSIEEEEEEEDGDTALMTVDQRPPSEGSHHYSSNNNICSIKQTSDETDRTKYQTTNRSTSLPSRQAISSTINTGENVRQRRRYASDSNKNNKNSTALLVTSFIQYLRSELRTTANDQKYDHSRIQKKKSSDNHNYLLQTLHLSNHFYRQQYPIQMSSPSSASSSSSPESIELNSNRLSNENTSDHQDDNEIFKLINLLILRVECLANDNILINKTTKTSSTIKQIDQNLMEYLYYLFNKFIQDEPNLDTPMIDKTNFVHVCQTLVRNGCFNIPSTTSPDQSFSETTITNSSDLTLTQTFVQDYRPNTDNMSKDISSLNEPISPTSMSDPETWLVVDLEPIEPEYSPSTPDESKCLLQSSTSDDQFLFPNESYFSFEELKSCESESSDNNYYSPNSSLVDIQNMVQEFDDINNINNNNNTIFNEDGSSLSIDHASNNTNVIIEAKDTTTTTTTNNNNICIGLTNDCEHVESSSLMESMKKNDNKISRREKKMQERWTITTKTNNNEQSPTKTFLGVEFPPIAVLRRKFSSLPPPTILNPLPIKKKDSSSINTTTTLLNNPSQDNIDKSNNSMSTTTLKPSMSLPNQEINPSIVNEMKQDQILDLHSKDTSSLNDGKNNDIQQLSTFVSELLIDEKDVHKDMTMKTKEEVIFSTVECEKETMININQNNSELLINSDPLNSSSPSSSLLSTSSSLTTNINENKSIELLPKEIQEEKEEEEEEEKKEEEYCDDDNVDVEKKNNCNVDENGHTLGTILINSEPTQAADLVEQEKKEKEDEQETEQPSSLLPTTESCNQSQPEDESSVPNLSTNSKTLIMTDINEIEQRYKTVEIEEIPDEDDDLSIHNHPSIEPIDCILTDDELKISRQSSSKSNNTSFKSDPVLSSYEKTLSKPVEIIDDSIKPTNVSSKESQLPPTIKRHQRPEDDPIALRALERFEQRMSAAAASSAKTNNDEINTLNTKGKSSWSGTLSTPRKSMENLFKTNQPSQSNSPSNTEQSTTTSPQRDTFIRPRKTMLDDIGLNLGMTLNLFGNDQSNSTDNNDNQHKLEEQQQPTAILIEDDNKPIVSDESTMKILDSEDHHQQQEEEQLPISINSSMTNESSVSFEGDNSTSLAAPLLDSSSTNSSLNTVISHSSSEQQSLAPYRLQLEGRPRLNTLERFRERHQNDPLNNLPQQRQQQVQNEYTVKPEDLQDPIIRRALERFDERSRSLTQAKSLYYDEIQDPITRRALMRLDTNLKRTIPTNPDPNETWYTNSYTLGSLQTNNGYRYPDQSLPPPLNSKPSHISVHQRFSSTSSSDMSELSANNILSTNGHDIPAMRVPIQPVYVTTNNQQPISLRQRSRSEDTLSSRELSIGQTTNLDENDISQVQENYSLNEPEQEQQQEISLPNETEPQLPNTIIKSLDPNFVRTAEASVNYATPTQSYAAYSCEYTRPHRNQLATSQKNLQQENEIQYPIIPSSSTFTPVHPPPAPINNNSYSQQSYNSMYPSNNPDQTPYSDDPIVRRALERFNSQMQNSLMNVSQHPPNMNYMARQFSHGYPLQGNFDSFQPTPDPYQCDPWMNSNRSMPPTPNTNTGYQSIIGRRRQIRHDDVYHDHTSVGNGYSSSLFQNSQNPYAYMNYSDESPPIIPPRLHRDIYHEQQEYLSENVNNNNNNNNNNHAYIHHAYPATINGFHPINYQFIPAECFQPYQEEEYLHRRAQSTSSNTSSDSMNPMRFMQQRVPPPLIRTNVQQNKNLSPDNLQMLSGDTTSSNGSSAGDSVFHRLAYTATKSSLSKSSSNLCANLLNRNPQQQPQQQQPQTKSNQLKSNEIDDDECTTNTDNNQESLSTSTNIPNKCQRSRSVDGRARLKNAQTRLNNSIRSTNDDDDNNNLNQSTTVPSSKFTSINPRRDVVPPPRIPITARSSIISDRTSGTKRISNGNNIPYTKNGNGIRTRGSNGNLIETENDENLAFNDNYQPKIVENKTRIAIPVHRYPTNNHIQTSASTSSVNSTNSRTKVPVPTSMNLLSPNGQRRNVPVSVFAPAKLENKLQPSSLSPTNESPPTCNNESQQEEQQQSSELSHSSTGDHSYTGINNENEINNKLSSTNSALKSSTGNILNELALTNDKHDNSKKMNVFERLFRGYKKKV